MMKNKYAPFFAAYNQSVKRGNPYTKEEVISNFTNGRTQSLKDLDYWELQELTRSLRKLAPPVTPSGDGGRPDKMRKAIIAIFKSMNKTVDDAKAWAEKQGAKGVKKGFNQYTTGELYILISIAEKIKSDWQKSIRKKVKSLANE
jgi:hypothetical protein